jgi:Xaa-Pro dipeptidase
MTETILSALIDRVSAANLDAVALVPGPNFRRLFGRDFHLMERAFVIVFPRKGPAVAVVPYLEMTSFDTLDFPGVVVSWRDETGYDDAFESAAEALKPLGQAPVIGLEAQRMRVFEQFALQQALPQAQFEDAHTLISELRLQKTQEEIAHLKRAIEISEQALEQTLQVVRVGQTEKQIEGILVKNLFAAGAKGLAFEPIVAAGDNSAQPHAQARAEYKIKPGDALLFDFGASYGGYNADITRTVFVQFVSEYDRAFYDTVRAANAAGKAATFAGATAHQVDDAVQRVLEQSQFAIFARHKTGHGLGLDVHEAPQIMRGNDAELLENMVFTVEPGLYRLGECGVRIEDDVVVTQEGHTCLTSFSRDLRLVGVGACPQA